MSYSRRERYNSRSVSHSRSRSISPYMDRRRSRSRSNDSTDAENPGNNLYVTGLSTRITKKELEKHFSSEGTVVDCHLVVDPRTRESRGFGFVTMHSNKEADRCIKYLDGSVLGGRVITVEKARRSRGRTPTPGQYLGAKTVRVRRRSRSHSPYGSDYSSDREQSYSPHGRRGRERYRSRSRYRSYSRSRSPYGRRYRSYSRDRSPYKRYDYRYRRERSRSHSPYYYYWRDRRSPYGRYENRYKRERSRSYSPNYDDRRERSRSSVGRWCSPDYRSPSPYERRKRSVSRSVYPRRGRGGYSRSVSPRCSSEGYHRRSLSRSVSPTSRSVSFRSRSASVSR